MELLEVIDGKLSEDEAWMRAKQYADQLRAMKLAGKWTVAPRRYMRTWRIEAFMEGEDDG